MAEQKYRQGFLGWLTGFDPNNPTVPGKPALSPAAPNGRGGANRPPAKPAAAPTPSQRSDYPSKPATSGAPFNPSGKRSVIKSGPDPLSANPTKRNVSLPVAAGRGQAKGVPDPRSNLDYSDATELPKSARGKPGYDATAKSKPSATAGRPSAMPAARKSPETAAKPAPSSAPKTNPAPASKKSWWDRFSDDHKLSADKSYADYKRLMGDN